MLGSNLVRMLLLKGYKVSVFLYTQSNSQTLDGLDITRYYGDITRAESLDEAMQGKDIVVHAAASTAVWPARSKMVRRINVAGTKNVIKKVLHHKVGKMIYIGSASSVNSSHSKGSKYAFPGEKFKLDYIDSKYHALQLILKEVKKKKLNATAILPTFMIGAYDAKPGSGQLILNVASGKLKFYSGGGRNFVHVNDVAKAIISSLDNNTSGKCYVVGNENLTYKEFFALVSKVSGKPEPKIRIPNWGIKTVGYLGDLYGNIAKKQPMLSYPMAKISCEKQFVENDGVGELNIERTPVKVAVKECYEWFLENEYIHTA